jgi:hypothetical protein
MYVVRQAHHERKKVNKFNTTTVRPEPVKEQLPGVFQIPLLMAICPLKRDISFTYSLADKGMLS